MASRILAIAVSALRDVLDAFDAPGLPARQRTRCRRRGRHRRLVALQNDDGGFPYLARGRRPSRTVQLDPGDAHARARRKAAGYAVPDARCAQRRSRSLADIEQYFPPSYDPQARDTLTRVRAERPGAAAGDPRSGCGAGPVRRSRRRAATRRPRLAVAGGRRRRDRRRDRAAASATSPSTRPARSRSRPAISDEANVTLRVRSAHRRAASSTRCSPSDPDSDLIPKVVAGLLAGQGPAGQLGQRPGELVHPARAAAATSIRSRPRPRLRGPGLARRALRRRARRSSVGRRPTERDHHPDRRPDRRRRRRPSPSIEEGAGRLYYRIGLRTAPASLDLAAARPRLRRRAYRTRPSTTRPTSPATPTARGAIRPAPGCESG